VADPLMRRAIIGDPRNDENVIVSQLQGLFHRFHNKVANAHPDWPFPVVQREVRFHYQWVVLNDFLPTIVDHHVLTRVLPHLDHHDSNMWRTGRTSSSFTSRTIPICRWSSRRRRTGSVIPWCALAIASAKRLARCSSSLRSQPGADGFREFPSNWAIDWTLFMNLVPRDPANSTRTNWHTVSTHRS
jgi:Animal haem peroxidase.